MKLFYTNMASYAMLFAHLRVQRTTSRYGGEMQYGERGAADSR